jgi:spermidine synthase
MDGRRFLITQDDAYDIIVMDAFGSSSIPFHLVTEEAFGIIRSRLASNGILAMNIHAIGWHDEIVTSIAATLSRQFEHVMVLPIVEPPDQLGNIVLLASDRQLELEQELPVPLSRFSAEYDQSHAWDNRFEVDVAGATILTDNLNPVDVWSERVNLASRKELHQYEWDRRIAW